MLVTEFRHRQCCTELSIVWQKKCLDNNLVYVDCRWKIVNRGCGGKNEI